MIAFFFGLNKRIVELNLLTNDKIKKKKREIKMEKTSQIDDGFKVLTKKFTLSSHSTY